MIKKIICIILCTPWLFSGGFGEDYYKIKQTKVLKERFTQTLLPLIKKANSEILSEREFVVKFFETYSKNSYRNIPKDDLHRLVEIKNKYKIDGLYDYHTYLRRIDEIPVSLALAQGAIESGWGKSRFAKEANNIYGHWTWRGKGLVPLQRDEGKSHKIRIFSSLQESVEEYALNLNTNRAYRDFRAKRVEARENDEKYDGLSASKTMINYSEIKEKYVEMLDKTIVGNDFLAYEGL